MARFDRKPLVAVASASKRSAAPLCALLVFSSCLAPARAQTPGKCPAFPADNIWNAAVDRLPLDSNSAAYVSTIGASSHLHPDFGSGLWDGEPMGIPYVLVSNQPAVSVRFDYSDESDPGPYPIPPNPPIEGGSDHHLLIVDEGTCTLYELYDVSQQPNGSWTAGSGAIFDLRSNRLRPAGWTSADAAGLPILPGLLRYDEALSGEIKHAIRFTAPRTRAAYVWPARHLASNLSGTQYPPMGQRFRLRADFEISSFSPINQTILRALKKYGMFLADNGSSWYITGAPDSRWDNDDLHVLQNVPGSAFEAVDSSQLMLTPDSAAVRSASPATPAITGIVSSASFNPGASETAWVSVFGTNLAPDTRSWRIDEIVNGALPTNLDGVSVSIGGQPAAISYISPGQLNVQVPDRTLGSGMAVRVNTPQGFASTTLAVLALAPGLFTYAAENHRYAAAQHWTDYSIAGKAGLYPGSSPARPGEVVILYGTGFGPTVAPQTAAGRLVTQPAALANNVTVFVGGIPAELLWAGRSAAGLDQINIRLPASLPDGDLAVVAEIAGARTQDNLFLTVAH